MCIVCILYLYLSREIPQKGPDRFSCFDVLQTNRHPNKQRIYIYIKSRFNNIFYQEEVRMLEESRREDSLPADDDEEARLDNNVDALQIVEER